MRKGNLTAYKIAPCSKNGYNRHYIYKDHIDHYAIKTNLMKKLLIYLILLIPLFSFGQYWAPKGAIWYYEQLDVAPPIYDDLITYESIGDTIVNGDSTKVILKTLMRIGSTPSDTIFTREIIYEKFDSNRVYFYYPPANDFRLLYDFNAVVGDSFPVFCRQSGTDSSVIVTVDSISSMIINGQTLKVQHVRPINLHDICGIGGTIIERVGWTGYMFPQPQTVDPPEGGFLRCYQDPVIGLYHRKTSIPCDYITSIKNINISFSDIQLFPNPSNGRFEIKSSSAIKRIVLKDYLGRTIRSF